LEVLVGSEESNELWHLDGSESTGLVNIEMSPSLGEVGGEISIKIGSEDTFMGAEDLLGAGGGGGFVNISGLGDVVGEDGSHEKIIIISGESLGIWDWDENVLFFFFVIGGVG